MEGITIRTMGPADAARLEAQPAGLFDHDVRPDEARNFLTGPDCILVAAFEGDLMVSFASGLVMRHPDKPPALFVNEVGTRDSHQRRGLARAVCRALFDSAQDRGITQVWLATEAENRAACALYADLGGQAAPLVGYGWGGALEA